MTARNWGQLIILSLIWGSSFLFIKIGVTELSPVWVVLGRLLAGALFLMALAAWRGVGLPPARFWLPLVPVAFFNNVLPFILIAWGETHIGSGLASVLNATTPLFSVLIMSTIGDERWNWPKGLGIAIGFLGVFVLVGADLRDLAAAGTQGQLAIVGASLCYAVGGFLVRRTLTGGKPLALATGQLLVAFALTLPMALLPATMPTALPSPLVLGSVAALGFLGSGLAYAIYYSLIAEVGATRTLVVTYLVPVTALFWGWLFLSETLDRQMLTGLALIVFGIILVNRRQEAAVPRVVERLAPGRVS